jgi:hypothetical protein
MQARLIQVVGFVWVVLISCAHPAFAQRGKRVDRVAEEWSRRDRAEAALREREAGQRMRELFEPTVLPRLPKVEPIAQPRLQIAEISRSTPLRLPIPALRSAPRLRLEAVDHSELKAFAREFAGLVSKYGVQLDAKTSSQMATLLSRLDLESWYRLPGWRRAELCRALDVLAIHQLSGNTTRVILKKGNEVLVLDHVVRGLFYNVVEVRSTNVIWEDLRADLKKYEAEVARPFAVQPLPSGVRIHTARGAIDLTAEELSELAVGRRLGPTHPLTKFLAEADSATNAGAVLYPDPLSERDDTEHASFLDGFMANLQQAYGSVRLLREPRRTHSSVVTSERINKVVALDRSSSHRAQAVIPPANVRDYKVMANFEKYFTDEGVRVLDFHSGDIPPAIHEQGAPESAVFLTGHSDKSLADLVQRLGRAGHFMDKYVVFQTCETPLTRLLKTEIIEKYFAIGVSSFVGEIEPAQVGGFLNDVAPWLSGHAVIDGGLRRFLRRSAATHGMKAYESGLERVTLSPRG